MSSTPKIVEQSGFDVIGIAVRTSNRKEISGPGPIGRQWGRFMSEGILDKIPNRADDSVCALYTAYASDRDGDFDFVIGARVSDSTTVPPGMVVKHVPAGKYVLVTSEQGPGPVIVPAAWQRIWQMEDDSQLGGARAYDTDFEVYDHRTRDPQSAQIDIYLGIR